MIPVSLRLLSSRTGNPSSRIHDTYSLFVIVPAVHWTVLCQCARFGARKIPLSRRKRPKKVRVAWDFVDKINDLEAHPMGSFEQEQFYLAKRSFYAFSWKYAREGESVMKGIELLTRVVKEVASCHDMIVRQDALLWVGNPNFFTHFFFNWRFAFDNGYKVIAPWDLAKKAQQLNAILPEFNISRKSISYLVEASIFARRDWESPAVAEKMLDNYLLYSRISPNRSIFNKLIDAWARSRSNSAFDKMDYILKCMRDGEIMPDLSSYNIMLRLSKDHADVVRTEKYLACMKSEGIRPGSRAIYYALLCFARRYKMVKAVKMFDELVDNQVAFVVDGEKYEEILSNSIEEIMYYYHKIVGDSMLSNEQRISALRNAENFVERYEEAKDVLDFEKRSKFAI
jgi:hypothetical protein